MYDPSPCQQKLHDCQANKIWITGPLACGKSYAANIDINRRGGMVMEVNGLSFNTVMDAYLNSERVIFVGGIPFKNCAVINFTLPDNPYLD